MDRVDRVKRIVRFIVFFDILFGLVYLFINGFDIWDALQKISIIITISVFFVILINKYLWKCKIFKFLFDSLPDLNGEWAGVIVNTKDKKEQKAYIVINQTYFEVYIKVLVERGNSMTWVGDIIKVNNNDWKLIWSWHSSNQAGEFSGTTIVNILDEKKLDGFYYTNSNIDGRGCTAGTFTAEKI